MAIDGPIDGTEWNLSTGILFHAEFERSFECFSSSESYPASAIVLRSVKMMTHQILQLTQSNLSKCSSTRTADSVIKSRLSQSKLKLVKSQVWKYYNYIVIRKLFY